MQKLITVIGMHRSGTSVTARALGALGIELGDRLFPPGADNPKGYWEDAEIVALNERVLTKAGSRWDNLSPISSAVLTSPEFSDLRREASTLLGGKIGQSALFAFKDPRTSVLLPFWRLVFDDAELDHRYVIALRNPLEVAASLETRNGFPIEKGALLWAHYTLEALRGSVGRPRMILQYTRMLSNPPEGLQRLAKLCGVQPPKIDSLETQAFVTEFIDKNLRRQRASDSELKRSPRVPEFVRELYFNLQNNSDNFDNIDKIVAGASSLLGPLDVAGRALDLISAQLRETETILKTDAASRIRDLEVDRTRALSVISDLEAEKVSDRAVHAASLKELEIDRERERAHALSVIAGLEAEKASERAAHAAYLKALEAEREKERAHALSVIAGLEEEKRAERAAARARLDQIEADRAKALTLIDGLEAEKASERAAHAARIAGLEAEKAAERASAQAARETLVAQKADEQHRLARVLSTIEAERDRERSALVETIRGLEAEKAADRTRFSIESDRLTTEKSALQRAMSTLQEQKNDLQARFDSTIRSYEDARSRREAEIADERAHALKVIGSLEQDLRREQVVSLDRRRQLDRVEADLHAIRASTIWRAFGPVRGLARRAPGLAGLAGRIIRAPAQLLRGAQAPPILTEEVAPTMAATKRQPPTAEVAINSDWPPFDPQPIAAMLAEAFPGTDYPLQWRTHCAEFPLPFAPDAARQDKLLFSDEAARDWIARCAAKGANLSAPGEAPDISIILPVYNQLPFTLSVIASAYRWPSRFRFEILLADDGSSDQTHWLEDGALPNVRVVRNPTNLGFLRNCNHAAQQARGRIIVLLNNDTIVLPGWLDELARTLDENPDIGLAGSKLIFPTGALQEAGGIVWRDGSAWNYGRGQDPRDPLFSYLRDVDYVSGASIALRASDWRKLGGFDADHYDTAYYEDTDLAFRVRAAGLRTVLQPLSMLVHFEGVSSGTDTSQGVKRFQVVNGERFFTRWKETLAGHRPNAERPELERERGIRKRLLMIDAVTPTPDQDAGSLVTFELMKAFQAQGWKVSFIPEDNFAYLPPQTLALQRMGVEAMYWPFCQSVDEVLEKRGAEFDAILMFRVTSSKKHLATIQKRAPHLPLLFHVADLHYLRERRQAELAGDAALLAKSNETERHELAAINAASLTIVHSTEEARVLAEAAPQAKVYVFPWIAEPLADPPGPEARAGAMFVGGFGHPPNVDAAIWLAREIWPLVLKKAPEARLKIIGSRGGKEIEVLGQEPGVEVLGWVPDLAPHLDAARLSIAPLRFGAGIKGKIISSLARGTPVACTPVAAEGMGLSHGQEVLIAEEPRGLAQAIVKLLTQDATWRRLSRGSLAFVEANYSSARAREHLATILKLAGVEPRQD